MQENDPTGAAATGDVPPPSHPSEASPLSSPPLVESDRDAMNINKVDCSIIANHYDAPTRDDDYDDNFGNFATAAASASFLSDDNNVGMTNVDNDANQSNTEKTPSDLSAQEEANDGFNIVTNTIEVENTQGSKSDDNAIFGDFSGGLVSSVNDATGENNDDTSLVAKTNIVQDVNVLVSDMEQRDNPSDDDDDDIGYFSTHAAPPPPSESVSENEHEKGTDDDNSGQQDSSPEMDSGYFSARDVFDGDDNGTSQVDIDGEEGTETKALSMQQSGQEVMTNQNDIAVENCASTTDDRRGLPLDMAGNSIQSRSEDDGVTDQKTASSQGQVDEVGASDDDGKEEHPVAAEVDNEEFGEFGDFTSSHVDSAADSVGGHVEGNDKELVEEDDLQQRGPDASVKTAGQSFDTAEDSVQAAESGEDVVHHKEFSSLGQADKPIVSDSDDDGKKEHPAKAEGDNDEDFGDFGDFSTSQLVSATESVAVPVEGNDKECTEEDCLQQGGPDASLKADGKVTKDQSTTVNGPDDDDDFGDFGTFEQAEQLDTGGMKEEYVDGDFGEFEDPGQKETIEANNHTEPQDDDEDFGEFGDFTDFASGETPQPESEKTPSLETAEKQQESRSTPSTSEQKGAADVDPLIKKAEAVFTKVFGRGDVASEPEQCDFSNVAVLVSSTLPELEQSSGNQDPSTWFTDSLASIMRGVKHLDRSGPVAIVDDDSEYPYAHFAVPICGLPVSTGIRPGSKQRARCRIGTEKPSFPDLKRDSSLKTESNDSTEPPPPIQQTSGTVVTLPPLTSHSDTSAQNGSGSGSEVEDVGSVHGSPQSSQACNNGKNAGKDGLSSSAKQFLQQIPDLSFMLKSTLSLPKKSQG